MCQLSKRQRLCCEGMVINHLCLGKVHWMTCFQCMLSKGRGGYISFLQGTTVFCQPMFQASSGLTNVLHRATITWHTVYNTFLLFWGCLILGSMCAALLHQSETPGDSTSKDASLTIRLVPTDFQWFRSLRMTPWRRRPSRPMNGRRRSSTILWPDILWCWTRETDVWWTCHQSSWMIHTFQLFQKAWILPRHQGVSPQVTLSPT